MKRKVLPILHDSSFSHLELFYTRHEAHMLRSHFIRYKQLKASLIRQHCPDADFMKVIVCTSTDVLQQWGVPHIFNHYIDIKIGKYIRKSQLNAMQLNCSTEHRLQFKFLD